MRVISRRKLSNFWETPLYADSEAPLTAWYKEAKSSTWNNFAEVKAMYGSASAAGNDRVVFNIHGNKYRLVVAIKYNFQLAYIRFIGTQEQYDRIDANQV